MIAQRCPAHPPRCCLQRTHCGWPSLWCGLLYRAWRLMFNLALHRIGNLCGSSMASDRSNESRSFTSRETGNPISASRRFASSRTVSMASDFWYKTPREKNIALMQKTAEERRKLFKQKTKWGDLSFIAFPAFNPDNFLVWLQGRIRVLSTPGGSPSITHDRFCLHGGQSSSRTGARSAVTPCSSSTLPTRPGGTWPCSGGLHLVLSCRFMKPRHGLTCRHLRRPGLRRWDSPSSTCSPAFYTDTTEGMVTGDRRSSDS